MRVGRHSCVQFTAYLLVILVVAASPALARTEIIERRDAYHKVFDNEDGTVTVELSSSPTHFQDENGQWQEIDTRLVPVAGVQGSSAVSAGFSARAAGFSPVETGFSATKNRFKVFLPGAANQQARFEQDGYSLIFSPVGVTAAGAVPEESAAMYSSAWADADLIYRVEPDGLKEDIVLHSNNAPSTFTFELLHPNSNSRVESDGSIAFRSSLTGEVLWRFPRPFVTEAKEGGGPNYDAVKYALIDQGSASTLSIVIDPAWLMDPVRTFPVLVDPTTISLSGGSSSSFTVYSDQVISFSWSVSAPTSWLWADPAPEAMIGTYSGGRDLFYREIWRGTNSGSSTFSAQRGKTYYLETRLGYFQYLFSHGHGSASLSVTYQEPRAPQTHSYSPASGVWKNTRTPTLTWGYTDLDSDAMVKYRIQVAKDANFTQQLKDTGEVPLSKATGTQVTHQWGTSLTDGDWYWRVQVHDGSLWSTWSAANHFKVDGTAPVAGTVDWDSLELEKGVKVAWTPFTDSGSGVSRYEVSDNAGSVPAAYSSTTNKWEAQRTNLAYDQTDTFRIAGIDAVGNRREITVETASPAQPTSIDQASASWTADGGYQATIRVNPATASTYRIRREELAADGSVKSVGWSSWIDMKIPTYVEAGLAPHGRYRYAVQTANSKERFFDSFVSYNQNPVVVDNVLPSAATLKSPVDDALINGVTMNLSFNPASDTDQDNLRYKVQWKSAASSAWSDITPEWSSSLEFPVDVPADGTYEWQILVKDDYMDADLQKPVASNPCRFTVDNDPPTVTFRIAPSDEAETHDPEYTSERFVFLRDIIPDSEGGSGVIRVRFRNGGASSQGEWTELDYTQGMTVAWNLPEGDGVKIVEAQAMDEAGNWGPADPAAVRSVTLDTVAPGVPAITSSSSGTKQITFFWFVPSDSGAGIKEYEVQYRLSETAEWLSLPAVTAPTVKLEGLDDNQLASIRVRAKDKAGLRSGWTVPVEDCSLAAPATADVVARYAPDKGHYLEFGIKIPLEAEQYVIRPDGEIPRADETDKKSVSDPVAEVTGLTAHTVYSYRIWTYNKTNRPTQGPLLSATTSNNDPVIGKALTPSGYVRSLSVTLPRDLAVDPDGDELGYEYYVEDANGDRVNADPMNPLITGLQEGQTYAWHAVISDGFGGSTTTGTATFTTDTTPPTIELDNVSTGWAKAHTVGITASHQGSAPRAILFRWNNDNYTEVPGDQHTLSAPEGRNELWVKAVDLAGNESQPISHVYNVDNVNPILSAPLIAGVSGADGTLYVSSNGQVFAEWEMSDSGSGIASYEWTITTDDQNPSGFTRGTSLSRDQDYREVFQDEMTDGTPHYLAIRVADLVGNSVQTVSSAFTPDGSAPVVAGLRLLGPVPVKGVLATSDFTEVTVEVDDEDPHSGVSQREFALLTDSTVGPTTDWRTALSSFDLANLATGQTYYTAVRVWNNAQLYSTRVSQGVLLDKTGPEIQSVTDEGTSKSNRTSLRFSVLATDSESGVSSYRYAVGTTRGGADVTEKLDNEVNGWISVDATAPELAIALTGLNLSDGTYYLTVEAINGVGLSTVQSSDGITIDSSLPVAPEVTDDGRFTSDTRELHASWTFTPTREVSHYAYRVQYRDPVAGILRALSDWMRTPDGGTESMIINGDSLTDPRLTHGNRYFVEVKAVYMDGEESASGLSDGIEVDATPPRILSFDDGDYASPDQWRISWTAEDPESLIAGFRYAVGTTYGGTDVTNGFQRVGQATTVTVPREQLLGGGPYYVTVIALNGAGTETQVVGDGAIIDSSLPPLPRVIDGGSYTNKSDTLSASWTWTPVDPESGTAGYEYAILTQPKIPDDERLWIPAGMETTITETGRLGVNGETYFFAVRVTNGAGLWTVGFSDGIVVDTTAPDPPIISDGDYSRFKTQLSADIKVDDPESNIKTIQYSVGSYDNPTLIADRTAISPTETRIDVTGVSLEDGKVYHFYVDAVNNAGLVSASVMSDGVMVDSGYPKIGPVTDEGEYTQSNSRLFASWTATPSPSGIAFYEYAVVTDDNVTDPLWRKDPEDPKRTSALITHDLVDGQKYYILVRGTGILDNSTPAAEWRKSDGIVVDASSPSIPVVTDDGAFTSKVLWVEWKSEDQHSKIAGYRYAVGTTRGGWDVTGDWVPYESTEGTVRIGLSDLDLVQDQTYYVSVKARNGAGAWSEPGKTDGIVADLTPPTTPVVDYPRSYVNDRTRLLGIAWQSTDTETGIVSYRYALTTNPPQPAFGPETEFEDGQTTLNLTDLNLTEGVTYFIAVQTKNAAKAWSEIGLSRGITVDTTAPQITFPGGGAELVTNSGQLEITWSTNEGGEVSAKVVSRTGASRPVDVGTVSAGTHTQAVSAPAPGHYDLVIMVTDAAGNASSEVKQPFRFNEKPQVTTILPFKVRKGEPFKLSTPASDPDGGTIAGYKWDFGDGTAPVEQAEPTYFYREVGTYTITVTATDNDGGEGTATVQVTVMNTSEGTLYLDETWDTPMTITGDVIVPVGLTLTIATGTRVIFAEGTGLTVQGRLVIAGADDSPVILAGAGVRPGFWKGITLNRSTEANSITGATIRDAARGLAVIGSPATVTKSIFTGNEIGLHAFGASPVIDACEFIDNTVYGLKEDAGANPLVTNSTFSGNGAGGYYDEQETIISVERLNGMGANAGNR